MRSGLEGEYKTPSIPNILSYSSAGFWSMLLWTVFGSYVFFFYERVLGLATEFVFFAMLIFTVWDAVNDPLIGFLTDRTTKFTKKTGKRFPWVVIGIIPATLMFGVLFMPPYTDKAAVQANPLPIFGWAVIMTCIFDSLTTLAFVNSDSLFFDKFRTGEAMRKARGWGTPLSMLALPVASIIPPFLITFEVASTYTFMAWIFVAIAATIVIILLPGMYENSELREYYYKGEQTRVKFYSELKSSLKQKSFVTYLVLFFGFQVVTGSLTASIPYAAEFVLGGPEWYMFLLFAPFLQFAIFGVPFWIWYAKRTKNNKKVAVIGGVVLSISTFITPLFTGIIDSMIYMSILGFMMANYWALMTIYFSEVLQERMLITRSPVRGTAVGVQAFFSRLSRGVQIGTFALVHILTGFEEGSDTQTALAKIGIRLHMGIIPALILAVCLLIFYLKHPLTPEKMFNIQKQLKEMGF
jgi:GPH family glycoside/pentoside/hexuronide:cation symporter